MYFALFIRDRSAANRSNKVRVFNPTPSKWMIILGVPLAIGLIYVGERFDLQGSLLLRAPLAIAIASGITGVMLIAINFGGIALYYRPLVIALGATIAVTIGQLYKVSATSHEIEKGSYGDYNDVFILDEKLTSLAGMLDGVSIVRNCSRGSIVATKNGESLFIPAEHILAIRHRASN